MKSLPLTVILLVVVGALAWIWTSLEGGGAGVDVPVIPGRREPAEPPRTEPTTLLPGREPASVETGRRGSPEASGSREALSGTFTVFGTVRDQDGESLADRQAYVELFGTGHTTREIRVDAEGRYRIEDVERGRYSLTGRARGCEPVEVSLGLEGRAQGIEKDLVLARHSIVVVIMRTPDGESLSDALRKKGAALQHSLGAVATAESPPKWFPDLPGPGPDLEYGVGSFSTRRDPSLTYAPDFAGELTVNTEPPFFVSAVFNKTVLGKRHVETETPRVEFTISIEQALGTLARATARVIDATTGAPLRATPMAARSVQVPGLHHESGRGDVEWKGLWAGEQVLRISATARALWSDTVELEPRQVLDLGTVALSQGVEFRAKVVDPDGKPVAAAFVVARIDPVTGRPEPDRALAYGSSREGVLRVRSLEPVRYLLHTRSDRELGSGAIVVDLGPGGTENLVITLQPTTDVTLRPGAGFTWYKIEDAAGYPIRSGIPRLQGFALKLVQGSYQLVLGDGSGELDRRTFLVGATPILVR